MLTLATILYALAQLTCRVECGDLPGIGSQKDQIFPLQTRAVPVGQCKKKLFPYLCML